MQQRVPPLSSSIKMGSAGRSNKSMRVSWAPEMNLCQVRLFLSEDAPSQSGLGAQDLLQAKASWLWHSTGADPEDQLPPGFEGPQLSWQSKKDELQLPMIKWRCPPRFVLNPNWQVVAGEESIEAGVQKQRELRVLEAVYPRLSSIPPSPSSPELRDHHHSDLYVPLIPITPIEEDDDVADASHPVALTDSSTKTSQTPGLPKNLPDSSAASQIPAAGSQSEQSQGNAPSVPMAPMNEKRAAMITPSIEQDVAEAAASVVFTAIMTSNREGSLIDRDLLIKILKNPKLMEELVREHGTATLPQTHIVKSETPSVPMTIPSGQHVLPASVNVSRKEVLPASVHSSRMKPEMPMPTAAPATEHMYPRITTAVSSFIRRPENLVPAKTGTFQAGVPPPPVKDINYYKSLIRQHGGEKYETGDQSLRHGPMFGVANSEILQRDLRSRVQKPCVYYNSPRGCRNGVNCIYLHDEAGLREMANVEEVQNSKRIKLEREITGRS